MKRDYSTGVAEQIEFFTGVEVEHTPAFGMKTLFVVGVQPVNIILDHAGQNECTHIYFGANMSYHPASHEDWTAWNSMIQYCLDHPAKFWCTLDFDITCTEDVIEAGLAENHQFIPQISVKLPYINQLGYNATLKIDDKDFDATNPGVWCHSLHDLQSRDTFTDWSKYTSDKII